MSEHPLQERWFTFWQRVVVSDSDHCWPFLGSRDRHHYGRFRFEGESRYAQRVAWTLAIGSIPAGMGVLHRCDNPPCCNPKHLFLGTQADNNADRDAKGRCRTGHLFGEAHPNAKLTDQQVARIRSLAPRLSTPVLMRAFGASKTTINGIKRGERRCTS